MNTITDYIFETEHRKNIHNVFEMSLISDIKDNLSKKYDARIQKNETKQIL